MPRRNKVAKLTHNGRSQSIAAWARDSGVKYATLRQRIGNGWTMAEALEERVRRTSSPSTTSAA